MTQAIAVFRRSSWGGVGWAIPVALLVAWELAVSFGVLSSPLAPSLEKVVQRFWIEASEGRLIVDIAASIERDVIGFLLGSTAGMIAGFLIGMSRTLDALFMPTFNAIKHIALLAWIPLMSAWFGVGEVAKVAFIAFAAFIPVLLNTRDGARAVHRQHSELGAVLTLGAWEYFRKIVFPTALPSIFAGLRLALIYSWLATVGAEYFMTAGPGLGGLMTQGRELSQMDLVLLGVFFLGLIGFLLNEIFARLSQAVLRHWPR